MGQLRCEMCESTDFLKQEGVFVCQSCGTKYSVEEAKKMMAEGAADNQETKNQNSNQVENLLQLAKSSYSSKNYEQAENFCNQILAIDSNNYEAWKLKGEAINFQITGTNDRITEVYNCIMNSYKVLDQEGKDAHREEVLDSLRECLEGEIDFALKLFKNNRPTDSALEKVKNTFINCASNVITSYEELGYSEDEADAYRTYIKNYFTKEVNKICEETWEKVVYYNYHRDGWDDDFHPNKEIFDTYVSEGSNLIELLQFAEKYFCDETTPEDKRQNYLLQNRYQIKISDARSYKRMVKTTTNGYGAVVDRKEYWEQDYKLSDSAIAIRQKEISRTCKLYDEMEIEIAKRDPGTRDKMLREWQEDLDNINESYRISGGYIFGGALLVACTYFCFTTLTRWFASLDAGWVGTIFALVFVALTICCCVGAHKDAKDRQETNQAKADRLRRKIKEIS